MGSANAPADFYIMASDPQLNMFVCHKGRSDSAIHAGKSPDGVLANLTIDKQVKLPLSGPVARAGWRIRLFISLDTADGIDVSDGVYQIAVTEKNKNERVLSASDLGIATDLPAATPAGSLIELGTGYLIPDGMELRVGSLSLNTPTVISLEDDA